jgi:hypothetical protein
MDGQVVLDPARACPDQNHIAQVIEYRDAQDILDVSPGRYPDWPGGTLRESCQRRRGHLMPEVT